MNHNQAKYGILGVLVGDALGVPYEFSKAADLPPYEAIEYEPPAGFRRAHRGVPPGTWSDDGSQTLCLLDAILSDPPVLTEALANNLVAWKDRGLYAVDGRLFDIGTTTNLAINRYKAGLSSTHSGMRGENTQANGSLMRTLPMAFVKIDDDTLIRGTLGQSMVTHSEKSCMFSCAIYVLWARAIAMNLPNPWDWAFNRVYELSPKVFHPEIDRIRNWDGKPEGSGFVIDSLYSAKFAVESGTDYESTVKKAILLGNDTDTTAAIAGGIAGIKYQEIPERWLKGLRGQEILQPLLDKLRRASIDPKLN